MLRASLLLAAALAWGCDGPAPASPLDRMVETQVAARGIRDAALIAAMRRVAREEFVLPEDRARAHEDTALPVGHGRTISQPYITARLIDLAGVKPGDRVLEIGTASGYQTAILAEMGVHVLSIEAVPELMKRAQERLAAYKAVQLRRGDGREGWPEQAPYQAVIVRSAVDQPPPALLNQLAEGGRLVAPVGDETFGQRLVRMTRRGDDWVREEFDRVRFAPLVETGR